MNKAILIGGLIMFVAIAVAAMAGAYFIVADTYDLESPAPSAVAPLPQEFTRAPRTIFAAQTPDWIKSAYEELAATVYPRLEDGFARKLSEPPTIFVVMTEGEENRFGFTGRARYGEIVVTLSGDAWQDQSAEKLDLFRRGMAHEFVHLWQWDSVGTNRAARMNWINEGVAQAIAAELMVASDFWTSAQSEAFSKAESKKCADNLADRALADATARSALDDAYYGCGFVIADVVSRAQGHSVLKFWREFFAAHQMQEYFEADDFFDFIRTDTNDAIFTATIDLFVNSAHRDPVFAIDNLYAVAEKTNARNDKN